MMWFIPDLHGGYLPESDECRFQAHRHEVDRDGNLTLFVDDRPSHVFPAGRWARLEVGS